ncbi:M4 family metallopeptidase [Streptomyces sp. NBC_00513]|uniref:M4 family metallopeptidase n=1 Tax=unclassified Streptomyces TaxID=2593676 RepID=UPI00224C82D9|nr:M4 family metallopeptidase [Streptomyces sp. NBC_00424]MCX5071352.1 M4 family metallopeptidase [Streptomyces sp. NBC_00424]WUD45238.1 M4 family metallopeptidase [Streptomyces sp. NBC_00513]
MTSAALIAVGLPATATATAVPGATARAGTVEARAGAMNVRLTADQSAALLAGAADWGSVAKALRLGEREALVPKSVSKDADGTLHTRYDRTFAGLPVLGGDLVVHTTPAGGVKGVTKASSATISLPSTTARKTADSARSFAESQARTDGIKPAEVKSPREVIWAASGQPVLAWETVVGGRQRDGAPSELHVVTDANTGDKIFEYQAVMNGTGHGQYGGQVTLGTSGVAGNHLLKDDTRGGNNTTDLGHSDDDEAAGTLFTDADDVWSDGSPGNNQSAAVDAHYGAQLTWDYFKDVHGRNGIRNDGVAASSRVHYGNAYSNAYWWDHCFCMTYGDGAYNSNPLTSIDVAAHEMSHGITSATAGLRYSGESGGLNEATSDIFGAAVEFWANNPSDPGDYFEGEKINLNGDGTPLRYMDKPSKDGDSADHWYPNINQLDVHYSSGPANHWFYLASEGSGAKLVNGVNYDSPTYDGKPVNPIGREAAAKIWFRALTTYMTSSTDYAAARTATLEAAADLYGKNGVVYNNVGNAWAAVNVGPRMAQGVTLTNPGNQVSMTTVPVDLQIQAVTSHPGATLTYKTTALPAGLTLNSSTGKITGTPTTDGNTTITLTVEDSAEALDTVSFTWLVYTPGNCTTTQLLDNPGFESGASAWNTNSNPSLITDDNSWLPSRTGSWKALLGGNGNTTTETITQTVYVPYGCKATATFWLKVVTNEETQTVPYDKLNVQANGVPLATYSNLDASADYVRKTVDLGSVAGRYVTLKFSATEDLAVPTYFLIDDTTLTMHP